MRFLSLLAAALPLASAVIIQPPLNAHVGETVTVTWVNQPERDPPAWNLFLMNISTSFDLKANFGVVDPAPEATTITFPARLLPR
ncbi:hypothetical protein DXG01_011274 [Tephrocybe rancida]|nr:hypothetical protein DXG01_011274 [Tephrocybe rancida]